LPAPLGAAARGADDAGRRPADLQNVLSDHSLTSWGQKDGLNSPVIWAIAQDRDGYIWLGTDAGAVRFDGVRFTPWGRMPIACRGHRHGRMTAVIGTNCAPA
jgi:ligand-binding sensor domain-containing protein